MIMIASATSVLAGFVTTTALPTAPASAATLGRKNLVAYRGLGTWVDAYDFSREKNPNKTPPVAPSAVDAMAKQGIKTLYLQASKSDSDTPNLLLSQDLLGQFLVRAHADHLRVVAWYLPKFTSPTADWNHIRAVLDFRANGQKFDSFGLDIESREQSDLNTRNTRLINLTKKMRSYVGDAMPLSAIVLPPVVTEVINKAYWPKFPWADIKAHYDVYQPMAYYTNRTQESGYRDPYRYITENVRILHNLLKSPIANVHAVGGIGDRSSTADFQSFVRGLRAAKSIGGSIYDWNTTKATAYSVLRTVPS